MIIIGSEGRNSRVTPPVKARQYEASFRAFLVTALPIFAELFTGRTSVRRNGSSMYALQLVPKN